ncbi:hypothetical protein EVAR_92777_1 [Eumeta japonica]|uniref:Uncharacterized protein n=1 Tax=Eumeta variegata TaxID=151549 RepID=A0A4C1T0U7_EUMVA|nr:hypothetical protein EVAR_92777_1 [Eumeta japonica]
MVVRRERYARIVPCRSLYSLSTILENERLVKICSSYFYGNLACLDVRRSVWLCRGVAWGASGCSRSARRSLYGSS